MYKIYSKTNNVFTEVSITDAIKESFKYGVTKGYLEVVSTGQIIDHTNYLQSFDFDDCRFVEGEGIIGSCVAKGLEGKFVNPNNTLASIENKDVRAYIGTTVNNVDYYIKLGTFIIQKPENDNATDGTSFEGLDYMIKFNKTYTHQFTGTYTLLQLLQNICTQAGVTCGTSSFRNSTYSLTGNPFDSGVTCRDVLKAIAQMAFSWARINENNELVLDFNLSNTISETIDSDEYYDLTFNDAYGPINTIVLKNSQVEGENVTIVDPNKSASDPTHELSIADNPFANDQATRTSLIQAGANLYGFTYIPVTFTDVGLVWLNCLDKVRIRNMQYNATTAPNEYYDTYLFDVKIHYDGAVSSEKETAAMTETETAYRFTGTTSAEQKRTELKVDKANQTIQGIIEKQEDLLRTRSGATTITIDDCSEGYLLKLRVIGNNTVFQGLVPSNTLVPSDTLVPSGYTTILVTDSESNVTRYDLKPTNVLRANSETYDEYVLDNNYAKIIRRVNEDGTTKTTPVTENIGAIQIDLAEGTNTIALENNSAQIEVEYAVKSAYTDKFATKVNLSSSITQVSNEINANVTQKLEDVAGTDGKVTSASLILAINNDESTAEIDADKVSLARKNNKHDIRQYRNKQYKF